jgi:DNA uptake protein ComE-like DNA-binding protein
MRKKIRHFWDNYNNFSKSDRNAILILGVLILLSIVANTIIKNIHLKSKYNSADYEKLLENYTKINSSIKSKRSLFVFNPNTIVPEMLDSLALPDNVKQNLLNYRNAGGSFKNKNQFRKIYGMNDSIFAEIENYIILSEISATDNAILIKTSKTITGEINPNIADYKQLLDFGFNSFQANNLISFRSKAGFFKNKNDLLKIYGIDSVFFKSIEDHILIENFENTKPLKIEPVLMVELNSADTAKLIQLSGIGSVYAKRIIKYRDLLGGFYSTTQLLEVFNFSEEAFKKIEKNITTDTLLIRKIRLNFAEFPELLRHPYFKKKQVEAIINYRNKNGPFQNLTQLKSNGLIDSETFLKIEPYLTCR